MTLDEARQILNGTYDFTSDRAYNNYEVEIERKLHKAVRETEAKIIAVKVLGAIEDIKAEIKELKINYDKSPDYEDTRTESQRYSDWLDMNKVLILEIIDKHIESEGDNADR